MGSVIAGIFFSISLGDRLSVTVTSMKYSISSGSNNKKHVYIIKATVTVKVVSLSKGER